MICGSDGLVGYAGTEQSRVAQPGHPSDPISPGTVVQVLPDGGDRHGHVMRRLHFFGGGGLGSPPDVQRLGYGIAMQELRPSLIGQHAFPPVTQTVPSGH